MISFLASLLAVASAAPAELRGLRCKTNLVTSHNNGTFGTRVTRPLDAGKTEYADCVSSEEYPCAPGRARIIYGDNRLWNKTGIKIEGRQGGAVNTCLDDDSYVIVDGSESQKWILTEVIPTPGESMLKAQVWLRFWYCDATQVEIAMMSMDGKVIASKFGTPGCGKWAPLEAEFNPGQHQSVKIGIRTASNQWYGNDFAMDDFSVYYSSGCETKPKIQNPNGPNLITVFNNGDFGTVNPGQPITPIPGSEYYACYNTPTGCMYFATAQIQSGIPAFELPKSSFLGGHTTGAHNDGYAVFNGTSGTALTQSIKVNPHSRLRVQFWTRNISDSGYYPLSIVLSDCSGNVIKVADVGSNDGENWEFRSTEFDVGDRHNVTVSIKSLSNDPSGNDFAIDDWAAYVIGSCSK